MRETDSVCLVIYEYSYLCIFILKQKHKQPTDMQCYLLLITIKRTADTPYYLCLVSDEQTAWENVGFIYYSLSSYSLDGCKTLITGLLAEGRAVDVVYLDFIKAFNTPITTL